MKTLKYVLLLLVLLPLTALATSNTDKVSNLHKYYFTKHTYIADYIKYGVDDHWEANLEGDCEDYALFMYKKAKSVNVDSVMWIVRTETNELHMVLVVDGDTVVDNRFDSTKHKSDLNYKWIAAVPVKHLEKY